MSFQSAPAARPSARLRPRPAAAPKPYGLIIFDWDGTLASSMGQIVFSVRSAFRSAGLPEPDERRVRDIIGLRLDRAMEVLWPGAADDPELCKALVVGYRKTYMSPECRAPLYDGVREGLAALARGRELAIATGKGRPGLEKVLRETGLGEFFAATRTADDCAGKPDPEMTLSILEELGRDPQDALVVGDTAWDLGMARAAQVDRVGMLYGAHGRDALEPEGPLALFDSFPELVAWIEKGAAPAA